MWTGIDTTLAIDGPAESAAARVLAEYQRQVDEVRARFNPLDPHASAAGLLRALDLLYDAVDSLPRTNGTADLLDDIFDEITYAINYGWIDGDAVAAAIRDRPEHVSIVATGRRAPASLIAVADTVTEMRTVRHAYDDGIRARRGID